jgi:hypothetical protein
VRLSETLQQSRELLALGSGEAGDGTSGKVAPDRLDLELQPASSPRQRHRHGAPVDR